MQPLEVIKINSNSALVESWQNFLIGQGFNPGIADGIFGERTKNASIEFQKKFNLQPDGIVGNKTFGVAMQLGFEGVTDTDTSKQSANFPPKSDFPAMSDEKRKELFEEFPFEPDPLPDNRENIRITNDWEERNIHLLHIPQLIRIKGNDRARFHRLAATQFMKLWNDWEAAGLLHLILTWDGSFNARFIRGSRTKLSNHAFGTALDINADFNKLNHMPALVGQKGSVRELVEIANQNGFFWGGHFETRKDGMHFEIAKLF